MIASRAAPQMATMIGEMPAAAISALMAPPPPAAVASASQLRPAAPGSFGSAANLTPVPPAPASASAATRFGAPAPALNAQDGGGFPVVDSPHPFGGTLPIQPLAPGGAPYQSQPGSPSMHPSGQVVTGPQTATRLPTLTQLLEKLAASPWAQRFMTLPPPRRLLFLQGAASGFGALVLVLMVLLLWPKPAPYIIRSIPDEAQVLRDGEVLGVTPLVLPAKKSELPLKLVLSRTDHQDVTIEITQDSDRLVWGTFAPAVPLAPDQEVKPVEDPPPADPKPPSTHTKNLKVATKGPPKDDPPVEKTPPTKPDEPVVPPVENKPDTKVEPKGTPTPDEKVGTKSNPKVSTKPKAGTKAASGTKKKKKLVPF